MYWSTVIAHIISNAGNRTPVMKLLDNFFWRQNLVIHTGFQPNQLEMYPCSSVINTCNITPTQNVVLVFTWKTTLTIIFTQISETGTPIQFRLWGTRTTNLVWCKYCFLYILHFPGWNSKHCSWLTFLKQLELMKQSVR